LAETGFGSPITMNEKPKKYEYHTHTDLELYDSRGIEIDPNYGVEINYNKIQNFINEQFQKNEPLDAIWYCITGTRMEDVEIELINKNPEDYYPTNKDILLYTNYHSKVPAQKRNISKNLEKKIAEELKVSHFETSALT